MSQHHRSLLLSVLLAAGAAAQSAHADSVTMVPEVLNVGQVEGAGVVAVENTTGRRMLLRARTERVNADGTVEAAPELVVAPAAFDLPSGGNRMLYTGTRPTIGGTRYRKYRVSLFDLNSPLDPPVGSVSVNWIPAQTSSVVSLRMATALLEQPAAQAVKTAATRQRGRQLQPASTFRVPRNTRPAALVPGADESSAAIATTSIIVDAVPTR